MQYYLQHLGVYNNIGKNNNEENILPTVKFNNII
jgi:hypothetical protein